MTRRGVAYRLACIRHLIQAELRERVRRYSFLTMLVVTLWVGTLLVPPVDAGYVAGILPHDRRSDVDWYLRGVYNSAWIGSMVALLASVLLSLPGFYLVKNAIERDRRTGVGHILATTPLSRPIYTVGKWLSSLALLGTMVGVLAGSALAMQLIRGEVMRVDLWALLSPFLLIAMPTMAVVAALAVFFETLPWLRGGIGNVVFFFVWMAALMATYPIDLFGLLAVAPQVEGAARTAYPDYPIWSSFGINPTEGMSVDALLWQGTRWTFPLVLQRLAWVAAAAGIALLAALLFDRFDPARRPILPSRKAAHREGAAEGGGSVGRVPIPAASLPDAVVRFRFWRLFLAELRLAWKGMPWWWFAVALGLLLTGVLSPVDVSRTVVLPLSWFWPVFIWSAMGVREMRYGTGEIVFSSAMLLRRQLPAAWLAGVAVSVLTGSGTAVRLILALEWTGLLAWAVGALFIPSLALTLGVWSGNSRFFEAVYTAAWYVGPVNGLPALDYMGALSELTVTGLHWHYLGLTVVLLALAALGRWRQIRG